MMEAFLLIFATLWLVIIPRYLDTGLAILLLIVAIILIYAIAAPIMRWRERREHQRNP